MVMGASQREGGLGPGPADALSAEKIEAIGIEYSYLLTSQLDSQRAYYEEQSMQLKRQLEEMQRLVENLGREFEKDRTGSMEQEARRRREDEERMAGLEKDKSKAEKKVEKVSELARKLEKELKEERAVSEGLMKNLGKMKERVEHFNKQEKELTGKIADLEDQVRDVMFFLEAKAKIEQGSGVEAEAAGGSIEMPAPVPEPTRTTARKRTPRKG
jgi:BRCA1-associated protein